MNNSNVCIRCKNGILILLQLPVFCVTPKNNIFFKSY